MSRKKPLPALLVFFLDLLGIGVMLGVFALFQFGMQSNSSEPMQQIGRHDRPGRQPQTQRSLHSPWRRR